MADVHAHLWDARTDRFDGPVLLIATPYSAAFVEGIKHEFAARNRAWIPEVKLWAVVGMFETQARELLREHFPHARICTACDRCGFWVKLAARLETLGYTPVKQRAKKEPRTEEQRFWQEFFGAPRTPPPTPRPTPPPARPSRDPQPTLAEAFVFFGLAPGATAAEIRRAFAKLALKHHPDQGGTNEQMRWLVLCRDCLLRAATATQGASW